MLAIGKKALFWPIKALDPSRGVVFVNTDGDKATGVISSLEEKHPSSGKLVNSTESRLVLGLIKILLWAGLEGTSIGVISPYRSQVTMIQEYLRNNHIYNVEASTIDKYQGKDKTVVIASFVRSNSEQKV